MYTMAGNFKFVRLYFFKFNSKIPLIEVKKGTNLKLLFSPFCISAYKIIFTKNHAMDFR